MIARYAASARDWNAVRAMLAEDVHLDVVAREQRVVARPDLADKLDRTRRLMEEAIADALIRDYLPLAEKLVLPDEDDRRVLAVAVPAGARRSSDDGPAGFPAGGARTTSAG